jgi:hypothetical protein
MPRRCMLGARCEGGTREAVVGVEGYAPDSVPVAGKKERNSQLHSRRYTRAELWVQRTRMAGQSRIGNALLPASPTRRESVVMASLRRHVSGRDVTPQTCQWP